jgi:hypothetical protein
LQVSIQKFCDVSLYSRPMTWSADRPIPTVVKKIDWNRNTSCITFEIRLITGLDTDSVICIATRCRLNGPGVECRWRRHFQHPFKLALKPIQPPVQRVRELLPRGKAVGTWR